MTKDYDWNDNRNTIIPQQDAIAIYLNDDGMIEIRQRDPLEDWDSVIVISKTSIPALIERLQVTVNYGK
jgi:hypothetical protein